MAPSIAEEIKRTARIEEEKKAKEAELAAENTESSDVSAEAQRKASIERKKQAEGDRSGIKVGDISTMLTEASWKYSQPTSHSIDTTYQDGC